jgi:hypothetical protein
MATRSAIRLVDHGLQVRLAVVVGMAALCQRLGIEVGLAAQLHDALGQLVRVAHLLVGMHEELVGNGRRGQAHGREMVALVTHHTDQLGSQRVIQQLDDVFAPGTEMGRHGAIVQAALGGLQRLGVQGQVAVAGVRAGLLRGSAVGIHGWSLHRGTETTAGMRLCGLEMPANGTGAVGAMGPPVAFQGKFLAAPCL